MASKSSKGLHRTLALIVNGQQQPGSFVKVRTFSAKPDAAIMKTDHLGEALSEVDVMHHGWDISFTIEEEDANAAKYYEKVTASSEAGTTLPRVDLIEIRNYVDPSVLPETFVYGELVLKMDSDDSSGRKEYTTMSFSGACKTRERVGV